MSKKSAFLMGLFLAVSATGTSLLVAGFSPRQQLRLVQHGGEEAPLAPFAYLVDGTWTAQGEIPGVGSYSAERTYQWVLGGKFIEQRHVMKFQNGEIETKGIIGWDSEKKTIMAWGFGSDGGIATSSVEHATTSEIRMQGVRVGGFNAGPIRASYQKVSENEFLETAEAKKGGDWTPVFRFRFTRKSGR